jgi:hypothetical protein
MLFSVESIALITVYIDMDDGTICNEYTLSRQDYKIKTLTKVYHRWERDYWLSVDPSDTTFYYKIFITDENDREIIENAVEAWRLLH